MSKPRVSRAIRGIVVSAGILALATTGSAGPAVAQTSSIASASSVGAAPAEVLVKSDLPDGSTRISLYLPAMGTSSLELLATLRDQGLPAQLNVSEELSPQAPCHAYGHAHTLEHWCQSPIRWSRNGFTNPQIYVRDTSGAGWPVGTTAAVWNESPNIHIERTTTSCPTSGQHCVYASSANYGATDWVGLTTYSYNSKHFLYNGVTVEFNDYYGNQYTSNQRRQTACHELGHAVGVDHNDVTPSCMYYAVLPSAPTRPTSDDFNLLLYKVYPR